MYVGFSKDSLKLIYNYMKGRNRRVKNRKINYRGGGMGHTIVIIGDTPPPPAHHTHTVT